MTYINKRTNQWIDTQNIVKESADGIIAREKNTMYFIDRKDLREIEEQRAKVVIPSYDSYVNWYTPLQIPVEKSNAATKEMYGSFFGFSFQFKRFAFHADSVYLSLPVAVNSGSIAIETESFVNDAAAVEYSVLDGIDEVPVLPVNEPVYIKNERLFSGLPTRFKIAENLPVTIKQGMDVVANHIEALEQLDHSKIHTISYTADTQPYYQPKNNSIRIKIVFRLYETSQAAAYVKNLFLRKYKA